MTDKSVPEWAIERAKELSGYQEALLCPFGEAFARYIAEHESPHKPRDLPELENVKKIWAGREGANRPVYGIHMQMLTGALDEVAKQVTELTARFDLSRR